MRRRDFLVMATAGALATEWQTAMADQSQSSSKLAYSDSSNDNVSSDNPLSSLIVNRATHPYPDGDKGDLWLLGGQSNMYGNGELTHELTPDPRILFYADSNEWVVAKDPMKFFWTGAPHDGAPDYSHLPVHGSGLGLFFAKHLISVIDRPIGLIGVQSGGPMTKIWDPTLMDGGKMPAPPYLYGPMIQRVIDAGGYGKLKGMIWYQGESDAVEVPSAASDYEHNLLNFVDRIRQDTGNPNLPIIIVQLARLVTNRIPGLPGTAGGESYGDIFSTLTQNWEHVREVQRQVAQKRDNVFLVASVDLYPMVDPIHLDYGAFQRLGPRIAEVAISEVYRLPGHGTPIRLESIDVEPLHSYKTSQVVQGRTVIRLRFSGVTGRLKSVGQSSGFSLRFPYTDKDVLMRGVPVIYATDFDTDDPAAILLRLTANPDTLVSHFQPVLYYGEGLYPFCTIVDDKDMAIPAFGPVTVG